MTAVPLSSLADQRDDSFARAFGTGRGQADRLNLSDQHPTTARRALELLSQIRADALSGTLEALNTVIPEPDFERSLEWPPKDVVERQEDRDYDRAWSRHREPPSDDQAECEHDAADVVLRTLAEHVAGWALAQWEETMRDFSHMIGLRRHDMADHVIEIDGTLHLYLPANVLLAGDRGYTSGCACGLQTTDPQYRGRIKPVARGLWLALHATNADTVGFERCRTCSRNISAVHGPADFNSERAGAWTPLPKHLWADLTRWSASRVYEQLRRDPRARTEQNLRRLALAETRACYLLVLPDPMQRNDKPCLWYRAPGLSENERYEVHRLTYDHRISDISDLLEQFPQPTADGHAVPLDAYTEQLWKVALLAKLRDPERRR